MKLVNISKMIALPENEREIVNNFLGSQPSIKRSLPLKIRQILEEFDNREVLSPEFNAGLIRKLKPIIANSKKASSI